MCIRDRWKDDVKTKSVTGKFPLLKYQQVDEYMLVQLLNLPADVSSYKVKLDGQEINIEIGRAHV